MGKLTELGLKALTLADVGSWVTDDGGLRGKVVKDRQGRVAVRFEYRYRAGERVRSIVIGVWPSLSLRGIRAERDRKRDEVHDGADPIEAARIAERNRQEDERLAQLRIELEQAKESQRLEAEKARLAAEAATRRTVRQAVDQWYELALSQRQEPGRSEAKRALEKDILPTLGAVRLVDVTKAMVMDRLDAVVRRQARILANRLFGDLRQFFTFCIDREWMQAHPLTGITRAKVGGDEIPRDRELSEDEIRELHRKLPEARLQRQTELAIWIMLGTCCRVGELSLARWEHVNTETGEWVIPASNTKNSREHLVYLSEFVLAQFNALRQITGTSEWCYPAGHREGPVCLKSICKQIRDRQRMTPLSNRSKATGVLLLQGGEWTAHDLRRTGATLMGELGVSGDIIERCLNHAPISKLVRTYQRHEARDEKRQAWRRLGERLGLLTSNHDNVVMFPKTRTA